MMRMPFLDNELLLRAMELFTGKGVDLDAAERAFAGTRGDFRAKLTAALQAVTVAQLKPERFIEIPANPESLSKAELSALVEPNVEFIRSNASKADLVNALTSIRYRQERRPAWMPRTPDSAVRPVEDGVAAKEGSWPAFTRVPLTLTGLPELGLIAAEVPSWYEDPVYAPDALAATAVQLALLTALGIGPDPSIDQTVTVQDPIPSPFGFAVDGAEASTGVSLSAADGPAAVIELLATTVTLGGVPVSDEDSESAALDVLASAGDWWHSPAIVLDRHSPFGYEARRTVARCSAAGWAKADGGGAGFVILADAIAADSEGTVGVGGSDLHRFMLWWELPEDSVPESDPAARTRPGLAVGTLHRLVLHCPGEDCCLRDGCPPADAVDIDLLVAWITDKATAVAAMLAGGDWATGAYLRTLVDSDDPGVYEEPGGIMWIAEQALADCGWQAASLGSWDTGDVDRLLYRDGHVVLVRHHLAERALSVLDGLEELDALRDMAEEDEALAVRKGGTDSAADSPDGGPVTGTSQQPGDEGRDRVHVPEDAVFRECLQRLDLGTMTSVTGLELPHCMPLLTLWPWGDGQPHGELAHAKAKAWIEGWLRGLPGIPQSITPS
jgi:hypothetical protein